MKQSGDALEHASQELQADREVVLAAVKQSGEAFFTLLRADREVVLAAVQQDGYALKPAAEPLHADREIVLSAVHQNGLALEYAAAALRADRDVVLTATTQNGAAMKFAADELRANHSEVQRLLAAALRHTQAELVQWRSGQFKLEIKIDVDDGSMAPAVMSSRDETPARGSKRPIEPTAAAASHQAALQDVKKVKLELATQLEESEQRYGELVGQGQEFSEARGARESL